ncbi:XRE family transcriptional regulator [Streptomyces sp. AV19]|uniref:XRE family transcriptional regulator n=1 Tax=Streptomyces sp. AV19 TaxID=2793068 RepID=UPI0018FE716A|nr:XRE family transcriptional regulator [Streptomyces sp. AV19]MBH1937846.1 XRE family transcriptional regulator [Streptomyces sp. AV19]MDG4537124.1 XRE family transcriptional regulator [Streptomyces sp. AV19]
MTEQPAGNALFVSARIRRGWHTQQEFAEAYERQAVMMGETVTISVRQVRRWESRRPGWPNRDARRVLTSLFGMPLEELGFVRPKTGQAADPPTAVGRDDEDVVRRRSPSLPGVLAAAPLLDAAGLEHLAAAVADARRYSDRTVVAHLSSVLDEAARMDSRTGPRRALPTALGIVGAIDVTAREAPSAVRRELLALGARAAEFTAWVHRDGGAPPQTTTYWHDRAIEWATLAGDQPMHAYVLLRRAQATERQDAVRMRDLAHVAARGPWGLPARARAEALQQEARALALTGAPHDQVARTLDEAHDALGTAVPAQPATCTGPLGAGYTRERLMVQSAICHREAGRPGRAADLLRRHLSEATFAPRDRAFFTAHLAGALAAVGEVDEAAATGMDVLRLAAGPRFGQALGELRRTVTVLRPHARRTAVRELRQALAALLA